MSSFMNHIKLPNFIDIGNLYNKNIGTSITLSVDAYWEIHGRLVKRGRVKEATQLIESCGLLLAAKLN